MIVGNTKWKKFTHYQRPNISAQYTTSCSFFYIFDSLIEKDLNETLDKDSWFWKSASQLRFYMILFNHGYRYINYENRFGRRTHRMQFTLEKIRRIVCWAFLVLNWNVLLCILLFQCAIVNRFLLLTMGRHNFQITFCNLDITSTTCNNSLSSKSFTSHKK